MKVFKSLTLAFFVCISSLTFAAEPTIAKNQTMAVDHPRIEDLLPGLSHPLSVEPALPKDYVAMSPSNKLSVGDWVYWGPKNVLQEYFKDAKSLKQPIIRVRLSLGTIQTGPDSFRGEENLKKLGYDNYEDKKIKWGSYPILSISFRADNRPVYLALVGTNSPDNEVLLVEFIYPQTAGHPDKSDLAIWNKFLTDTKPLPEKTAPKSSDNES